MKTTHIMRAQRLALLLLASVFLVMVGTGCNTAQGFGKDVEKAGEGIQEGTK